MIGFRLKSETNNKDNVLPGPPYLYWRNNFMLARLLPQIDALHQQGIKGDQDAVQTAFNLLERVRQSFPGNHLVEAYYGSILTLQGRDALDPMERLEKVRLGLKCLDEAVRNEPDNIEIRILRGYVCYHLPEVFFHRTATGIEDFTYLMARYEKDPQIISETFHRQIAHDLRSAKQTLDRHKKTHTSEIDKKDNGAAREDASSP